ncbi:hypothetical protein Taro_015105 [Colocasia esculenta]|uniref:Uncharacterized protein n=1 Tax=Colocasia esculenta TaxID=4460 RepID=A0A843UNW9_COLES|nr:hypothetical protein [Colocasia esculenta]
MRRSATIPEHVSLGPLVHVNREGVASDPAIVTCGVGNSPQEPLPPIISENNDGISIVGGSSASHEDPVHATPSASTTGLHVHSVMKDIVHVEPSSSHATVSKSLLHSAGSPILNTIASLNNAHNVSKQPHDGGLSDVAKAPNSLSSHLNVDALSWSPTSKGPATTGSPSRVAASPSSGDNSPPAHRMSFANALRKKTRRSDIRRTEACLEEGHVPICPPTVAHTAVLPQPHLKEFSNEPICSATLVSSPGARHLRACPRDRLLPLPGTPIPAHLLEGVLQAAGVLESLTWSEGENGGDNGVESFIELS